MSETLAILASIENRPSLFAPNFTHLPAALAAADTERKEGFDYGLHAMAAFGFNSYSSDKPFFFSNGVAVIPVMGALLNRYNWVGSYASGYQAIRTLLNAAVDDPEVKGIILDVNSNGGMVQGCFELADDIFAARSKKPILSVIDANAYSAGYALASSASKMVSTRSGGVGSIGVVMMHADYSGMLKDAGIKITFIHAGAHKVDGNPYQPLPDSVKAELQAECEQLRDEFVALVARNRGLEAENVKATEARTYRADEALSLGLIDGVASPAEAVAAFIDELVGSDYLGAFAMTTQAPQPEAQAPDATAEKALAAEAKRMERERVAGIMNCEEAKGKSALANHLALNTELSVEDAKGILAAATAAPAEAPAPVASVAFEQAMAEGNPNVGASGDEGSTEPDAASQILNSYAQAGGKSFLHSHA